MYQADGKAKGGGYGSSSDAPNASRTQRKMNETSNETK